MKQQFGKKGFIGLLLAFVLVFAAGCQAVGGVDFNQMIKQSLKVTSMEGKQSIEFQMLMADGSEEFMSEEEAELFALLSNIKLDLNDIKVKDTKNMSLNGRLSLGEAGIGFSLKMTNELAVIQLEGASRPFMLDLTDATFGGLLPSGNEWYEDEMEMTEMDADSQAHLVELGKKVIDVVGGYAIDNLPNPTKLQVNPARELINGESLNLLHVQTVIDGTDVMAWVMRYLEALEKDSAGLEAMLNSLFELLFEDPSLWESLGISNPLDDPFADGQTKEQLIQEATEEFMMTLKDAMQGLREMEADEEAEIFLNEHNYIKTDLYVDTKMDIRKSVMELVIKPQFPESDEEDSYNNAFPFEGIMIRTTNEMWNVNGEVAPEIPAASSFAITLDDLAEMQSYEIVRLFDAESEISKLLKLMGMNKQTIMMDPVYDWNPPIRTPDGITLIPLRDTLDQLGGSLAYDTTAKQYVVYDKATLKKIYLTKDSKSVQIDNKAATWSFPVTNIGGTLYVPGRDFITALGGTIQWEDYYMDEKILVIEREL